jgi:hypothetical protein
MVQQRAEENGIDQTNLKSVYKRYLQYTTSYGLPKAIRALFQNEIQLFSFDWPSIKGSMSRWLAAAKVQMKTIIDDIPKLIQKEYPSLNLKLRFVIVTYRDLNDKPIFHIRDFIDNTTEVIDFLNRVAAGGGDDIPKDILGALDQCLNLNCSKTNAKFIVLIALMHLVMDQNLMIIFKLINIHM